MIEVILYLAGLATLAVIVYAVADKRAASRGDDEPQPNTRADPRCREVERRQVEARAALHRRGSRYS